MSLVFVSLVDLALTLALDGDDAGLSQLTILRLLRMLRILRAIRLLRAFRELYVICKGVMEAMRTMFWVCVLLVLIIYVFGIACAQLIGAQGTQTYPGRLEVESVEDWKVLQGFNPVQHFGGVLRSMYTLFQMVSGDQFQMIGGAILEKQPLMVMVLALFVIFAQYALLNVIIGVIVEGTIDNVRKMRIDEDQRATDAKMQTLTELQDLLFALDVDSSGTIGLEELQVSLDDPRAKAMWDALNLPDEMSARELLQLFDGDGDGELSFREFAMAVFRLIGGTDFHFQCLVMIALNDLRYMVRGLSHVLGQRTEKGGGAHGDDPGASGDAPQQRASRLQPRPVASEDGSPGEKEKEPDPGRPDADGGPAAAGTLGPKPQEGTEKERGEQPQQGTPPSQVGAPATGYVDTRLNTVERHLTELRGWTKSADAQFATMTELLGRLCQAQGVALNGSGHAPPPQAPGLAPTASPLPLRGVAPELQRGGKFSGSRPRRTWMDGCCSSSSASAAAAEKVPDSGGTAPERRW